MRPGGATVVALEPDERLTVVDSYGGQVAELTVLSPEGADDASAFGARADAPATVLRELVRNGNGFLQQLAAPKLRPDEALAVRLFESMSPPGASQSFRAEREVKVVVAAPAGRIVDGAPPPSDLLVEIRRGTPRKYGQLELPAPLAEPRLDFRVDKATALAYEVRAGEYIQVIDVEGKQCSDFLAFHRGRLEDGIERGLDATVTRSITGTAYPAPGLFGKFYDADMNPLVEVVRDTVGRHDTFQLACYAKYYEDMGYPVTSTARTTSTASSTRTESRSGRAGPRSTSSSTRPTPIASWPRTSRGRGRATTCSCGRWTTSSAPRPPVPTTSIPRTAGRSPTSTCACTRPSTRFRRRSRGA